MDASAVARGRHLESASPAEVPKKSGWPKDGGLIDATDKALSNHVFGLELGVLEWPLSVPGCWFGTAPVLIVGPLALAVLSTPGPVPIVAQAVLIAASGTLLGIWFAFCAGNVGMGMKFLWRKELYLIASPLGLLLARLAGPEAWGVAAFFPLAWSLTLTVVFVLKGATKRLRPATCNSGSVRAGNKRISIISQTVLRDPTASFPSGDVAGAVSFAVPLALGAGMPVLAWVCVLLSAIGRMYWLAHHFMDVVCGGLVGILVCTLLRGFVCEVGGVRLWQPLLAHAFMLWFLTRAFKAVKH